jgi:uncharacterized protein (TIGR03905 family)
MEHISYSPRGVCSRHIDIDVENDIIRAVTFTGGCAGNTQGVARLLVGMTVNEAIERLNGIQCGMKPTSCPDQVAQALRHYLEEKNAI